MDYNLLNAIAITVLALGALWIFSSSVVHPKDPSPKEKQNSDKPDA